VLEEIRAGLSGESVWHKASLRRKGC
jgi:hypothetical protein